MRAGTLVFVDTGAWIALAVTRDPHHERAIGMWDDIVAAGAKPRTSIPVVLETFTFLERNTRRDVALRWKDSLDGLPHFGVVECTRRDVTAAWKYFERKNLHKLSAVDATSFAIMRRLRIRQAFSFDVHFAAVGFDLVG